jgi:hypothetical protein
MSEEDEKERARDYVERVKESSLAKAPQHQRAEMAAYWQSRAGLFRALAKKGHQGCTGRTRRSGRAGLVCWRVWQRSKPAERQMATSFEHFSGGLGAGSDSFRHRQANLEGNPP